MRWAKTAGLLVLLGCADDGDEPGYVGGWQSNDPMFDCTYFMFLDADQTAEFQTVCGLKDGSLGAAVSIGVYEANGSRIRFTWEESSCPSDGHITSITVSLNDGLLSASTPDGVIVFEPFEPLRPGSGGASAAFGCFGGPNMTFEPGRIRRI